MAGEIVAGGGAGPGCFCAGADAAVAGRAKVLCGTVTVANAAVAADAAAFVVVVSSGAAARAGLRIVGGATLGGRPEEPGLAPVAAIAAGSGAGRGARRISWRWPR